MEKYKLGKVLGDGTFGTVTMAQNCETGQIVAIKKMKKKIYKWEECTKLQEIKAQYHVILNKIRLVISLYVLVVLEKCVI